MNDGIVRVYGEHDAGFVDVPVSARATFQCEGEFNIDALRAALAEFGQPPSPGSIGPVNIVVSSHMSRHVQWRFPRSRKRRIREKWAKRPENWRIVPMDCVLRLGNAYVMHPALKDALEVEIRAGASKPPLA